MKTIFPYIIENTHGEKLIFKGIARDQLGEYLEVENEVKPGAGPIMHVHFRQDEGLTVTSGTIGYKIQGKEEKFAGIGETIHFKAGVPHKFWNAGEDLLTCTGFIRPPDNIVYFLNEIFRSMDENGGRPGFFDGAYLSMRYQSEFAITEIPVFVRKVVFPIVVFIGKLLGKYKKYADAPEPFL
jgi:quercetin dioxygenase-like cupin family protein